MLKPAVRGSGTKGSATLLTRLLILEQSNSEDVRAHCWCRCYLAGRCPTWRMIYIWRSCAGGICSGTGAARAHSGMSLPTSEPPAAQRPPAPPPGASSATCFGEYSGAGRGGGHYCRENSSDPLHGLLDLPRHVAHWQIVLQKVESCSTANFSRKQEARNDDRLAAWHCRINHSSIRGNNLIAYIVPD